MCIRDRVFCGRESIIISMDPGNRQRQQYFVQQYYVQQYYDRIQWQKKKHKHWYYGTEVLRSLTVCCSGSAICTRGCAGSATPPPPSATPPPSSGPCVAITAGTSVAGPVNSVSCKRLAKLRVVLHQRTCQVSQPVKINTNSHPICEGLTLTVTQPVKDNKLNKTGKWQFHSIHYSTAHAQDQYVI